MICEDADLDAAVADAIMGIAFQNGEVCFAASRLFLHESVRAEFLERFAAALAGLRIGDALDEATHVGPLVCASAPRARARVRGAGPVTRARA